MFGVKTTEFMEFDDKPIRITDVRAVRLAKQRAIAERRSFANAAAVSIIERLGGTENSGDKGDCQDKTEVNHG